MGTGLSAEEVSTLTAYFRKLGRDPTVIEIQTIAQTWSEHCFHKVFKSKISVGKQIINGLFRSYIQRATDEIGAKWVVSAFTDNAGVVSFDGTVAIAAKVETHNHPSAVEPFGGAATGVGGVIRDILGVWAEPIGVTDTLFFGDLNFPFLKLPAGVKHPRYLLSGVVAGVGNYGNNMGIPTINGGIYFDDAYTGYTLVFCGCIGLLKARNYAKTAKSGDILVIAGGRTGQDGIHGVNFASEKIEGDTDALRSAVQIPDPIVEEKVMRAVLEIGDQRLASGITDLGGGGLSSGVCELAKNFGCGARVDLASVPLKTIKIEPWEIWVSESQERMLVAVPRDSAAKVLSIFEAEEVEASVIGELTQTGKIVLQNRGEILGELELGFLFSPPLPKLLARIPPRRVKQSRIGNRPKRDVEEDFTEEILSLLRSPNIASKEHFVRTYDFEVKGNTVLKPFEFPGAGPNDAAVLKPLLNSSKGLVVSCGYNPRLAALDPYWMAASSIDEAVRNNVAAGGRRIALLDNFSWGNPDDPQTLGSLVQAARACYDVAKAYQMPFISGKDSLYNETPLGEILPTLVVTALGIAPDITKIVSASFKTIGDAIYLVGETKPELGGSEYYHLNQISAGMVPEVDLEKAPALYRTVSKVIDQSFVKAVHDLSQGGLAVALVEMCISNALGAEIILPESSGELTSAEQLFSESNSRFLVEVPISEEKRFQKIVKGFPCIRLGTVTEDSIRIFDSFGKKIAEASTESCTQFWKSGFSPSAQFSPEKISK